MIAVSKPTGLTEFKRAQKLMGNHFEFTVVAPEEDWANQMIDMAITEIRRIESLLTTFRADSQTNEINENAGIRPVKVDGEVLRLIQRSIRISELTGGAFDLTYGSVDKSLWNFDQSMKKLPSAEQARSMVRLINYKDILVDERNSTIMLAKKGMRIGFGGIGKGYAAEMAKILLQRNGVSSGIVNASGDLTAWGQQANGKNWTIGIADPARTSTAFSTLDITNMAIATSGNYEKYVVIDGKKYSHTINPKTGLPVSGIKSVTVISPNAEIADAMATPITIMGVQAGIALVNQINHLECIIITDNNKVYSSKNIHFT